MIPKRFLAATTAIFVLFTAIFLPSCTPDDKKLTDYASQGFTASVSFERGGVSYAARVRAGEPPSGENAAPRDLELTFTAPETMSGLTTARHGGELRTACGGVELEGDVGGWLSLAELLIPLDAGRLISVEAGRGAAAGRTMAEFLLNDGRRCVINIDNASGLPISVECGEDNLQIIFEGK